jgi:predicted DNA-binding transcriptional regulator AlpA
MADSALLDTKQASALFGLSESTLRKWRLSGQGPAFVRLGRAVKYRQADIDQFLDERLFHSTAEADAG